MKTKKQKKTRTSCVLSFLLENSHNYDLKLTTFYILLCFIYLAISYHRSMSLEKEDARFISIERLEAFSLVVSNMRWGTFSNYDRNASRLLMGGTHLHQENGFYFLLGKY